MSELASILKSVKLRKNVGRVRIALLTLIVIAIYLLVVRTNAEYISPPLLNTSQAPPSYKLTFGDEFNGNAVNTSNWNVQNNSNYGSANREDQCFRSNNVGVSEGYLKLTAKRETVQCGNSTNPDTGNPTYYFTSGMVTTKNQGGDGTMKYQFKQGYVEASIKMPAGNPFWLGFWLVGGDGAPSWPNYGEMDIAELVTARPDLTNGTFHYTCGKDPATNIDIKCKNGPNAYNLVLGHNSNCYGCKANFGSQNTLNGAVSNSFHRYGLLWEADRVTWYLDGKPFRTINKNGQVYEYYDNNASTVKLVQTLPAVDPRYTPFDYNHTIHITSSIGGAFPNDPNYGYTGKETSLGYNNGNLNASFPSDVLIDYVRVFQKDTQATDLTIPTADLVSPLNNSTVSGTATIAATASDNVGIKQTEYFIDGVKQNSVDTVAPYSFSWDSSSVPNGTHVIGVEAVDYTGNRSLRDTVVINTSNGDQTKPSPATNISATANSYNKVTVYWTAATDNIGVTNYILVRNGITIATLGNETTYVDTAVTANTKYDYYLIARDAAGNLSVNSSIGTVTTPNAPDTQPPSAPLNLTATAVSPNQINLKWNPSTDNIGVTSYEIWRKYTKIATVTTTSFGETGLKGDTIHTYSVRAIDAAGNIGPFGKPATTKTPVDEFSSYVFGRVLKSSNGEPVQGANISTYVNNKRMIVQSNNEGWYALVRLPANDYVISHSATSLLEEKAINLTLKRGEVKVIYVRLADKN